MTEIVAARDRVLRYQSGTYEADQVAMGLGRRHAGLPGEIAQHHRRAVIGQHPQQGYANLDGLYPLAAVFLFFFT